MYLQCGCCVRKILELFVCKNSYQCGMELVLVTGEYRTTTFTFDDANQLVSSTSDGVTTRYEYDAAGRLVKEGNKTYTYGYLDKVMSVRFDRSSANSSTSQPLNSSTVYTYTYHPDGQLATADYGKDGSEDFTWDGLALVQRGNEHFINEPHVGGGNPVASSKGTSYFNDALGTTVGAKSGKTYSAATLTAFGENLNHHSSTSTSHFNSSPFFTGKPHVAGLGHAFLMRNYRAGLGKWQTADPLGYPDGWNALAYCRNGVIYCVDQSGCVTINLFPENEDIHRYADNYNPANEFTVGGHGSGSQGVIAKSVSELAELIRTNSSFDGKTNVWLYSCFVANGSYAQELANELGVKVWAADNYVWFDEAGYLGIFPKLPDGRADYLHHGNWVPFRPE